VQIMMKLNKHFLHMGIALFMGCLSGVAQAGFITFSAAGANAAEITPTVDSFRAALGTLNPNDGSHHNSGRREINWDGVPDGFADPIAFPSDFFNSTTIPGRSRGALFTTPGTGFLVSADSSNPSSTAPNFGFSSDFVAFSQERLFTPVDSNVTDTTFFVPGTTTQGTVSGFGAVFSDAEVAGLTKIEFFDAFGTSLFSSNVEVAGNGGFSFLGAIAGAGERISKVRITTGDIIFLDDGNFSDGKDTVVMDDFIYGEPVAVPEPGIAGLFGIGWLAWLTRKRVKLS
jgi:hypothetical protein